MAYGDRVNEVILIREGLFEHYPNQINEDHFTTDSATWQVNTRAARRIDGVTGLQPEPRHS
jgi:hypothetical protein